MTRAMKPFLVAGLLLVAMASLVFLVACRHFHVYSIRGWEVYCAMGHECHSSWADYNFCRIRAGDGVEEVIARTSPITIERKGRWVVLGYQSPGNFTGMTAAAYDGKMVIAYAWSCSWVRLFFDELDEDQSLELLKSSKRDPRRFGIVPVYRS
jgi:hypothetical protein